MKNYDSWSPLKEVWLGDCYPKHFYDHLDSKVKDCFYEITEITQHDLSIISQKLQELGVTVNRPIYNKVDDYIINGNLLKPHITPRDFYFTFDNNLYFDDDYNGGRPWTHIISDYQKNNLINVKRKFNGLAINGANIVKAGKDIFFDLYGDDSKNVKIAKFKETVYPEFSEYRCHVLFNGGHTDGCFAILKPGLILASSYFTNYSETFPGWEIIELDTPEFMDVSRPNEGFLAAKNWYLPNINQNDSFNQHIIDYALDWVGNYKETYFDINCLVVDEKNVLMLGENHSLYKIRR